MYPKKGRYSKKKQILAHECITPKARKQQGGGGVMAMSCTDEPESASPPPRNGSTCRLLSSVMPYEILSTTEPRFVKPIIPDGISL